jgi:hypothetical protein
VKEMRLQRNGSKPGLIDGNNGWTYVGTHNLVKIYTKTIPGSNLLAFRGVTILDVHISHAMGPFVNISNSLEWVSMLKAVKSYPIIDENLETNHPRGNGDSSLTELKKKKEQLYMQDDILYQVISLPWPVTTRDILLKREFDFDEANSMVSVKYHSVEDDRVPLNPSMIRAISPHTMWRFTGVNVTDLDEYEQSLLREENEEEVNRLLLDASTKECNCTDLASVQWKNQLFPKSLRRYFSFQFKFIKTLSKKLFTFMKSVYRKMGKNEEGPATIPEANLYQTVITSKTGSSSSVTPNSPSAGIGNCSNSHVSMGTRYTLVEIETIVDSRGSVPVWFLNFMQR